MVGCSTRIRYLVTFATFLLATAQTLATELPFDSRPLVEVHSLDSFPKEVTALIGWPRQGPDGITERYDQFNSAGKANSDLPRRYLKSAAVGPGAVVMIYEEGGSPPTYHALAYMMTRTGWDKAGEWAVDEDSARLTWFLYEVDSVRYGQAARLYIENKRKNRVLSRISLTYPIRRNGPVRKENLSDNEAREIQSVMARVYPGVLLNISEVVTGCACEDSPACSDQVWVVPRDDVKTPGVLLSRISNRWTVGPVQQWWLDRAELKANTELTRTERADALSNQWQKFPECPKATVSTRRQLP